MSVKLGLSHCGGGVHRVFAYGQLKNILRPKREEVTGDWRKLQNEELHDLYCSPNIIKYYYV
jgi:hypothetical protein